MASGLYAVMTVAEAVQGRTDLRDVLQCTITALYSLPELLDALPEEAYERGSVEHSRCAW